MPIWFTGALVVLFLQANVPTSPSAPLRPSPNLQALIEKAKKDLAQRLSIPPAGVSLVRSKAVTWSNSSLGCPQPGMVYADVLTPGYLIVLKAEDREYEYHSSRTTQITSCRVPAPPLPENPADI